MSPGKRAFVRVRHTREGATDPKIASPTMPSACAAAGWRGGNFRAWPPAATPAGAPPRLNDTRLTPPAGHCRLSPPTALRPGLTADTGIQRFPGRRPEAPRAKPPRRSSCAPRRLRRAYRRPAYRTVRVTIVHDRAPEGGRYSAGPHASAWGGRCLWASPIRRAVRWRNAAPLRAGLDPTGRSTQAHRLRLRPYVPP